jgi:hypothetical protein
VYRSRTWVALRGTVKPKFLDLPVDWAEGSRVNLHQHFVLGELVDGKCGQDKIIKLLRENESLLGLVTRHASG